MKIKSTKIAGKYEITIICPDCKQIVYKNSEINPENLKIRLGVAEKQRYCFSCNSKNSNSFIGASRKLHRIAAIQAVEKY